MMGSPMGAWVSFRTRQRERAWSAVAGSILGAFALAVILWQAGLFQ